MPVLLSFTPSFRRFQAHHIYAVAGVEIAGFGVADHFDVAEGRVRKFFVVGSSVFPVLLARVGTQSIDSTICPLSPF